MVIPNFNCTFFLSSYQNVQLRKVDHFLFIMHVGLQSCYRQVSQMDAVLRLKMRHFQLRHSSVRAIVLSSRLPETLWQNNHKLGGYVPQKWSENVYFWSFSMILHPRGRNNYFLIAWEIECDLYLWVWVIDVISKYLTLWLTRSTSII